MRWIGRVWRALTRPLQWRGWSRGDELKSAHWKRASALYRWQQHNKTTRR